MAWNEWLWRRALALGAVWEVTRDTAIRFGEKKVKSWPVCRVIWKGRHVGWFLRPVSWGKMQRSQWTVNVRSGFLDLHSKRCRIQEHRFFCASQSGQLMTRVEISNGRMIVWDEKLHQRNHFPDGSNLVRMFMIWICLHVWTILNITWWLVDAVERLPLWWESQHNMKHKSLQTQTITPIKSSQHIHD